LPDNQQIKVRIGSRQLKSSIETPSPIKPGYIPEIIEMNIDQKKGKDGELVAVAGKSEPFSVPCDQLT